MIAQWVAGALLRKENDLRLNKEDLVEWHLQGCRVNNGSPHNLLGQYASMHVGKSRLSIQQRLMESPTEQWPTEPLSDFKGGPTVVLPSLEVRLESDGTWLVPLLPTAKGHALNASFDPKTRSSRVGNSAADGPCIDRSMHINF